MAMLLLVRGARRSTLVRTVRIAGLAPAPVRPPFQHALLATSTSETKNLYEKAKETLSKFANGMKEFYSDSKVGRPASPVSRRLC